jgi:[acyl-carrier-protein] S-malonyltransferase
MKRLAGEESKCRCIPLHVDYPFHSDLLKSVEEPLNHLLEDVEFRDARSVVVSNHTGATVWTGREWKRLIARQLCGAVHWEKSVRRMVRLGATTFVEMGPGRVLRGLIRRIAPSIEVMTTDNVNTVEYALNQLGQSRVFTRTKGALEATACAI